MMAHRYGLNTELERTETNSRYPEFVRVSFSSLLIDCHEIPIFQTGLTGLTRCVLLFNPVILPEINKAQLHKSLNSEDIIRQGTQMTRIRRIYTDPCVSASSAQSVFYIKNDKTQIHSLLAELSACYTRGRAGNADERRFVHLISAFIEFFAVNRTGRPDHYKKSYFQMQRGKT